MTRTRSGVRMWDKLNLSNLRSDIHWGNNCRTNEYIYIFIIFPWVFNKFETKFSKKSKLPIFINFLIIPIPQILRIPKILYLKNSKISQLPKWPNFPNFPN